MLADTDFTRAVALVIEQLRRFQLPTTNRALNMVVQDILRYYNVKRLRNLSTDELEPFMYHVYQWTPSEDIERRLKFDVYSNRRGLFDA